MDEERSEGYDAVVRIGPQTITGTGRHGQVLFERPSLITSAHDEPNQHLAAIEALAEAEKAGARTVAVLLAPSMERVHGRLAGHVEARRDEYERMTDRFARRARGFDHVTVGIDHPPHPKAVEADASLENEE